MNGLYQLHAGLARGRSTYLLTCAGWVLYSQWKHKLRWDSFMCLLLLFLAFFTPFEVAFLNPHVFSMPFMINRFADLIFIIDIYLNFHIACPRPGVRTIPALLPSYTQPMAGPTPLHLCGEPRRHLSRPAASVAACRAPPLIAFAGGGGVV
jgi:hypothetical protein